MKCVYEISMKKNDFTVVPYYKLTLTVVAIVCSLHTASNAAWFRTHVQVGTAVKCCIESVLFSDTRDFFVLLFVP